MGPAYPRTADIPMQVGPLGIRSDLNFGARTLLPEEHWRVRLSDIDTGNALFESENRGTFVTSSERWFGRFRLQVWALGADGVAADMPVFVHDYNARSREVLIHSRLHPGRRARLFPYPARFAEERGCRLACAISDLLIPLLRKAHPYITFLTHGRLGQPGPLHLSPRLVLRRRGLQLAADGLPRAAKINLTSRKLRLKQ